MLMSVPRTRELDDAVIALRPHLYAFAMSLVRDEVRADDLVQDTMVRALANHTTFEPGTNLGAWLFTILRNLVRSQWRRRRREVEDPDEMIASAQPVAEDQMYAVLFEQMMARMRMLPLENLAAFRLVCMQGLSYEEAAEHLQTQVGTIKSRVNRAKTFLAGQDVVHEEEAPVIALATDRHKTRISKLWRDGLSAGQIAEEIPGLSRSDVMLVIVEAGLSGGRRKN